MNLSAMACKDFCALLASDAPAPGGGSAAAFTGALGVSLAHMVAALTTGREKYQASEPLVQRILVKSKQLQERFIALVNEDTAAFNGVSAVFQMPKGTDEEKQARKVAMQAALKECTKTPFQMMQAAYEGILLIQEAVGKTNGNAVSDLGVAALTVKAAAQGAWLNVLTNVDAISDAEFVRKYRTEGAVIVEKTIQAADAVYMEILKSVEG